MKLTLVRHGETGSNLAGALDTAIPGANLSPTGMEQSAALIDRFGDVGVDGLFASTLIRTQQTLAPLSQALQMEPVVLDGLREIAAGDYEMATDQDSVIGYITIVGGWISGETALRMPGGETGDEFLARYDAAVDAIVASGAENAVLVSHGAAIRTWIGHRCDLTHWADAAMSSLPNTGAIELEGAPGDWEILSWTGRSPDTVDPYVKS